MTSNQRFSKRTYRIKILYLSCLLIIITTSSSLSGWVSFREREPDTVVESETSLRLSELEVSQDGCNISLSLPGVFIDYQDGSGQTGGKYAKFSLHSEDIKISNTTANGTLEPDMLGKPNLPFVRFKVLIPNSISKDQISIKILNTEFKAVGGTYVIAPIQELCYETIGLKSDKNKTTSPMNWDGCYKRDEFFGYKLKYEAAVMHGYKFLTIKYCPLKYNPVKKKLLATGKARFAISFKCAPLKVSIEPNMFTNVIAKTTFDGINGNTKPKFIPLQNNGTFIIVSASKLINTEAFEEYITYRENQGYTHIKTLNADNFTSSQITDELKNLYNIYHMDFIIVIGDETVVDIPIDVDTYHYKDWARLDGKDTYEDVCLGIFLCNTETGLKTILQHQKWHEEGGDWPKTVINTLGANGPENPLKRFSSGHYATRNWDRPDSGGLGYAVHRVYEVDTMPTQGYGGACSIPGPFTWEDWTLTPDPFYTNSTKAVAKIYEYWNSGTSIVMHRDHGSPSGASRPAIRMSSTITNNCSPFFLSINSSSGDFKGRHSTNFAYLTQSKTIGTCVTLASTSQIMSGDSDKYLIGMLQAMFPEDGSSPERCIGMAHIYGQMAGDEHSRTYFHNFGDVMTMLNVGE